MELRLFTKQVLILLLLLGTSIFLHESGHYLAAASLDLSPEFAASSSYVAVKASPETVAQSQFITNMGIVINLLIGIILFFYIIARSRVCSILQDTICFYVIITAALNFFIALAELLQSIVYL